MVEELRSLFSSSSSSSSSPQPLPSLHESSERWAAILSDALKREDEKGVEDMLDFFTHECLPQLPSPGRAALVLDDVFKSYSSTHEKVEIKLCEARALAAYLESAGSAQAVEGAVRELQQILQRVMSGSTAVKVDEAIERSLDTYDQRLRPEDVCFVSRFSRVVVTLCVKIAYLCLSGDRDGNWIDATAKTITRGSRLLEYLTPEMSRMRTAHAFLHARVLECRGDFLRASKIFFEIAQNESGPLAAEDSLKSVVGGFYRNTCDGGMRSPAESALVCAVLAQPGPERSKMLGALRANERLLEISEQPFFSKITSSRIARREDILEFERSFALLPREVPVFRSAVAQHNLLCASRVYMNASFGQLAEIMCIEAPEPPLSREEIAEDIAVQMINDGRLDAEIDQVDSFIFFKGCGSSMPNDFWNDRAQKLCTFIDTLTHPHTD